ncbi:MAG: succinate dehydrogenase [Chloroflexota bacterium]
MRRDTWWLEPLITVVVLGGFVIYATWAVLTGENYWADPYLSPFFSPLLAGNKGEPLVNFSWWRISPAILMMWAPLGFRLTCYYYRKAYYRAFFWDPPACAVGELRGGYIGEQKFPFILQNAHRFFLYLAVIVWGFLTYDAIRAFFFPGGFGMGIGTLVLVLNSALLGLYTFSCHSIRHLAGGCLDCPSNNKPRLKLWQIVSRLNARHPVFAWCSLVWVAFSDLYIRLVATGAITDLRIF